MSAHTRYDFSERVVLLEAHRCPACGEEKALTRVPWEYDDGVDPYNGWRYYYGSCVLGDAPNVDYGPSHMSYDELVASQDARFVASVKADKHICGCGWGASCDLYDTPNYDPFAD